MLPDVSATTQFCAPIAKSFRAHACIIDVLRAQEAEDRAEILRGWWPVHLTLSALRGRRRHRVIGGDGGDDRAVMRDDEHVVLERRVTLDGDGLVHPLERNGRAAEDDAQPSGVSALVVDVGDVVVGGGRAPGDVRVEAEDDAGRPGKERPAKSSCSSGFGASTETWTIQKRTAR